MGVRIAPVAGSGGRVPWMVRVERPRVSEDMKSSCRSVKFGPENTETAKVPQAAAHVRKVARLLLSRCGQYTARGAHGHIHSGSNKRRHRNSICQLGGGIY